MLVPERAAMMTFVWILEPQVVVVWLVEIVKQLLGAKKRRKP